MYLWYNIFNSIIIFDLVTENVGLKVQIFNVMASKSLQNVDFNLLYYHMALTFYIIVDNLNVASSVIGWLMYL